MMILHPLLANSLAASNTCILTGCICMQALFLWIFISVSWCRDAASNICFQFGCIFAWINFSFYTISACTWNTLDIHINAASITYNNWSLTKIAFSLAVDMHTLLANDLFVSQTYIQFGCIDPSAFIVTLLQYLMALETLWMDATILHPITENYVSSSNCLWFHCIRSSSILALIQ